MNISLLIILAYCAVTLIIGFLFRKSSGKSRSDYFLAGRSLSGILFFFTMTATNFSAFTIFGLSGAGYRIGYAFYPVMGFATGFMALGIYLCGSRILRLRKNGEYLTPGDFIQDRYKSPFLKYLVSVLLIIFTLPYISIQASAAGNSLASLTGLPYFAGASLITGVVILYVSLGGLRSIAWTDGVQWILMFGLSGLALLIIIRGAGGWQKAQEASYNAFPSLFSRPGLDGSMTPGVWFGYYLLWFLSVPLTPQIFQRYLAVKDLKSLKTTVVLYPLVTTLLFFFTVSIGVLGRGIIPDLHSSRSDTLFPLLLSRFTAPWLSALLFTGSLAALMSTMDSQLLTLTSMVRSDFTVLRRGKKESSGVITGSGAGTVILDRAVLILLGFLGLVIAAKPPETLLSFINATTFPGIAVLAPTFFGGLYIKKGTAAGAFLSILAGETLVVLYYFKLIPSFGFLPIVPISLVTFSIYFGVSLLETCIRGDSAVFKSENPAGVRQKNLPQGSGAGAVFKVSLYSLFLFLGNDTFFLQNTDRLFLYLPLWVWYYIVLGLLLSFAYKRTLRHENTFLS